MHVQITTRALVVQNVLVNPLVTNLHTLIPVHPARDLFRAPVSAQLLRYQLPRLRLDALMRLLPPRKRNLAQSRLVLDGVCLLWPISAPAVIAAQLATNC